MNFFSKRMVSLTDETTLFVPYWWGVALFFIVLVLFLMTFLSQRVGRDEKLSCLVTGLCTFLWYFVSTEALFEAVFFHKAYFLEGLGVATVFYGMGISAMISSGFIFEPDGIKPLRFKVWVVIVLGNIGSGILGVSLAFLFA